MRDDQITKAELLQELDNLRSRVSKFTQVEENLKQYQFMVESASDAIFFKDLKSRYVIANNKALEAFGLSREQVIGKNDYEIMPNKDEARKNIEDDNLVFKTGKLTEITKHMTGTDGKERWFQAIKVPQFDDGGNITGLIGIARDITESKRAEEALRESEHQKRAILDSTPDLAWLKNKEGVYLAANEPLCKAFGVKLEDLVGKTDFDISPEDLAQKYRADDEKVMKSGKRKRVVEQWGKKKGKRIWIETIKTPIYNEKGELIGTSGIARDITEQKKAEQDLQARTDILQNIISNIPYYVFWKDKNSIYLGCNDNFAKLAGVEKIEDIIGKTDYDLPWKKEESDFYRKIDKEVISKGVPILNIEEPVHPGEGKAATLLTSKVPLRNADGEITGILGIFTDITERKKAEEQIRRLSSAVEQSTDGISVAIGDLEPRLVYVNGAFARMHGYTPKEMVGMPVAKLHNEEQISEYKTRINQIITEGSTEGEIVHVRKDGTTFPTYISFTLLKDDEGKTVGSLGIVRDITESKQREKELNLYRENMARAEQLASLGTLSATLAHELTQPLTVIGLSIGNSLAELEATSYPGNVIEDLKEGLNEISNMTSMVDRFRKFARMSNKRTVSEVDLKVTGERIAKLLDERAWRAKVTLQVEGMDKLPHIHASEKDVEQLFFALVENAIQAADGKEKHQVIISGAVRGEDVELQFSDNCGGIAPENLDRIFEPFFTTRPEGEGTGLGLCIVQDVVSKARGKVRVESEHGKGSTFFVTLPINIGEK